MSTNLKTIKFKLLFYISIIIELFIKNGKCVKYKFFLRYKTYNINNNYIQYKIIIYNHYKKLYTTNNYIYIDPLLIISYKYNIKTNNWINDV